MAQFVNSNICTVSSTSQHDVESWKRERLGYFTATRWGTLMRFCKTEEQKQELAKKICGLIKDEIPAENMKYVQYGLDNEDTIRKILETQIGMKVYEIGLCKSKIYDMFACSVDGIMENGDIAEFKTTKKEAPIDSYPDFREIDLGYYYQMQHNMALTGAKRCHFFSYSYTSNSIYYRIVPFSQTVWDELRPIGIDFVNRYIDPIYDRVNKCPRI